MGSNIVHQISLTGTKGFWLGKETKFVGIITFLDMYLSINIRVCKKKLFALGLTVSLRVF